VEKEVEIEEEVTEEQE